MIYVAFTLQQPYIFR